MVEPSVVTIDIVLRIAPSYPLPLVSTLYVSESSNFYIIYVTVSAKTRLVHTIKKYFLFIQQCQQCPRNGPPKFQPSLVCSFGIIAIDSRKSKVRPLQINSLFPVLDSGIFACGRAVHFHYFIIRLASFSSHYLPGIAKKAA